MSDLATHVESTKINKFVWIKTQFEGFHRWKDAPDDVAFLRDFHRHVFHVKIGVEVGGDNREVEFFQFKRKVEHYLDKYWHKTQFENSCEQIAVAIGTHFDAFFVEVSEDGENGAFVTFSKVLTPK